MARHDDLYTLPGDLPVPVDDGACAHLIGQAMPSLALTSTSGRQVRLTESATPWVVVYAYPRTGHPDRDPPDGWNLIPGARGCTPQSCAFRDLRAEFASQGATVYGLSSQPSAEQHEAANRLHLPFELLSDSNLALSRALQLPTFEVAGMTLIKRLTLIIAAGRIAHVFYPVFPPDQNARDVLLWLEQQNQAPLG